MATTDPGILVVGAGPVGLTAALELARRGLEPRIIDDDAEPTPESRALRVNGAQEYTALRHPAGRAVLDFTEQQTRQIVSRSLWADVLRRWLGPAILKVPAIRRRLLSRVAGLDTPRAPWLEASGGS